MYIKFISIHYSYHFLLSQHKTCITIYYYFYVLFVLVFPITNKTGIIQHLSLFFFASFVCILSVTNYTQQYSRTVLVFSTTVAMLVCFHYLLLYLLCSYDFCLYYFITLRRQCAPNLTHLFCCSLFAGGGRSIVGEGDGTDTSEPGKKKCPHGSHAAALRFATETRCPSSLSPSPHLNCSPSHEHSN